MSNNINSLNKVIIENIKCHFNKNIVFEQLNDLSILCKESKNEKGDESINTGHVVIEVDEIVHLEFQECTKERRIEISDRAISIINCQLIQYDPKNIGIFAMQIKVPHEDI